MNSYEKPEKSHENPNLFWPRDRCVRAKEALEKVDRDEDTDASQMATRKVSKSFFFAGMLQPSKVQDFAAPSTVGYKRGNIWERNRI